MLRAILLWNQVIGKKIDNMITKLSIADIQIGGYYLHSRTDFAGEAVDFSGRKVLLTHPDTASKAFLPAELKKISVGEYVKWTENKRKAAGEIFKYSEEDLENCPKKVDYFSLLPFRSFVCPYVETGVYNNNTFMMYNSYYDLNKFKPTTENIFCYIPVDMLYVNGYNQAFLHTFLSIINSLGFGSCTVKEICSHDPAFTFNRGNNRSPFVNNKFVKVQVDCISHGYETLYLSLINSFSSNAELPGMLMSFLSEGEDKFKALLLTMNCCNYSYQGIRFGLGGNLLSVYSPFNTLANLKPSLKNMNMVITYVPEAFSSQLQEENKTAKSLINIFKSF